MKFVLKYISLLLLFPATIFPRYAYGQEKNNFRYYDSLTLEQYQHKEWQALIDTSHRAYNEGIDYYYLRMRTGIAWYEKENYRRAIKFFRKALEFNTSDPVAGEYLYYSLLFSGRDTDALLFYHTHKNMLPPNIEGEKKLFRNLFLNVSYHQNVEENQRTLFNNTDLSGNTGKQVITRRFVLGSLYLEHDLTPWLRFFHGGTAMKKYNYYYTRSSTNVFDSYDHIVRQFQYYGGIGINPGGGFYFDAALHYIHYYSPPLVYRDRGFGGGFIVPHEEYNYTLWRASLWKSFGLFTTGAGFSLSNLNNAEQFQGDYSLIFYPLGNLDLYFSGGIYLVNEKFSSADDDLRLVYEAGTGVKVSEPLWIETTVYLGEIKNMAFNEGFIIYNGSETVNTRTDLALIFPLKKVSYSLTASYLNYTSKFTDLSDNPSELNNIISNGFTLTGGLKWKF